MLQVFQGYNVFRFEGEGREEGGGRRARFESRTSNEENVVSIVTRNFPSKIFFPIRFESKFFFFFFSSCLNFRRQFIYLVSRLAIFSPTLSHRLINVYFRDKKNSILECKNIGFRRVERSSILLFRYGNPTR